MRDQGLQTGAVETLRCAARHHQRGIGGPASRHHRVDGIVLLPQMHIGHGDARRQRHVLDELVEMLRGGIR